LAELRAAIVEAGDVDAEIAVHFRDERSPRLFLTGVPVVVNDSTDAWFLLIHFLSSD
jgi:hypothetical protein